METEPPVKPGADGIYRSPSPAKPGWFKVSKLRQGPRCLQSASGGNNHVQRRGHGRVRSPQCAADFSGLLADPDSLARRFLARK